MATTRLLKTTVYTSLLIQVVTGILNIGVALFDFKAFSFSDESKILVKLLWLAIFVQIIEGVFYLWLAKSFDVVQNITVYRYYDWFITTPTMLFILIVYLSYLNDKEYNKKVEDKKVNDLLLDKEDELDLKKLQTNLLLYLKEHRLLFSSIVVLNALMLFFGFSGEMGWISNTKAILLGFIPFIAYFYIIYENYAKHTKAGSLLFYIFTAIWSLYGISAFASYIPKNISYNILDLVSKNCMEIYLSVVLLMVLRI
jgi:hypothetical protein|uniref:Uncharacterized protein n=1 Tax=viral metagenome TaxID=1070528 RepID=A0A6C0IMP6_9ZZZZ